LLCTRICVTLERNCRGSCGSRCLGYCDDHS